ncbi:hypothetical protein DLAC_07540 [Tieghemostelium lacteum]|uniref:Uncharacterized protein n=1 Tax=Tieghemostelium lacteum TaxID=361077 RepID=A0A151ZCS2_TIELA|nr:hypothetical protein DLAC_07540 [Tieghemostelium lacteum]|eukprot:KYQ91752.1 hypothetical protein DLAC_07540 [Tieghemostelium lacteum]
MNQQSNEFLDKLSKKQKDIRETLLNQLSFDSISVVKSTIETVNQNNWLEFSIFFPHLYKSYDKLDEKTLYTLYRIVNKWIDVNYNKRDSKCYIKNEEIQALIGILGKNNSSIQEEATTEYFVHRNIKFLTESLKFRDESLRDTLLPSYSTLIPLVIKNSWNVNPNPLDHIIDYFGREQMSSIILNYFNTWAKSPRYQDAIKLCRLLNAFSSLRIVDIYQSSKTPDQPDIYDVLLDLFLKFSYDEYLTMEFLVFINSNLEGFIQHHQKLKEFLFSDILEYDNDEALCRVLAQLIKYPKEMAQYIPNLLDNLLEKNRVVAFNWLLTSVPSKYKDNLQCYIKPILDRVADMKVKFLPLYISLVHIFEIMYSDNQAKETKPQVLSNIKSFFGQLNFNKIIVDTIYQSQQPMEIIKSLLKVMEYVGTKSRVVSLFTLVNSTLDSYFKSSNNMSRVYSTLEYLIKEHNDWYLGNHQNEELLFNIMISLSKCQGSLFTKFYPLVLIFFTNYLPEIKNSPVNFSQLANGLIENCDVHLNETSLENIEHTVYVITTLSKFNEFSKSPVMNLLVQFTKKLTMASIAVYQEHNNLLDSLVNNLSTILKIIGKHEFKGQFKLQNLISNLIEPNHKNFYAYSLLFHLASTNDYQEESVYILHCLFTMDKYRKSFNLNERFIPMYKDILVKLNKNHTLDGYFNNLGCTKTQETVSKDTPTLPDYIIKDIFKMVYAVSDEKLLRTKNNLLFLSKKYYNYTSILAGYYLCYQIPLQNVRYKLPYSAIRNISTQRTRTSNLFMIPKGEIADITQLHIDSVYKADIKSMKPTSIVVTSQNGLRQFLENSKKLQNSFFSDLTYLKVDMNNMDSHYSYHGYHGYYQNESFADDVLSLILQCPKLRKLHLTMDTNMHPATGFKILEHLAISVLPIQPIQLKIHYVATSSNIPTTNDTFNNSLQYCKQFSLNTSHLQAYSILKNIKKLKLLNCNSDFNPQYFQTTKNLKTLTIADSSDCHMSNLIKILEINNSIENVVIENYGFDSFSSHNITPSMIACRNFKITQTHMKNLFEKIQSKSHIKSLKIETLTGQPILNNWSQINLGRFTTSDYIHFYSN